MDTIEITWEAVAEDPRQTTYFVNGLPVGQGDGGIDKILELIRIDETAKVTLGITSLPLGGEDIKGSTPFANRFDELEEAVGKREIVFKFF